VFTIFSTSQDTDDSSQQILDAGFWILDPPTHPRTVILGAIQYPASSIQHLRTTASRLNSAIGYHVTTMSKKRRTKKKKKPAQPQFTPPKKNAKYSPGEIAMAVLGAALLIMVAGIIITSLLG